MPGNEREAALTFKLKDAEAFSSELDRILGKLEKIESFSARVGGAAGGGGGAAPTVVGAPVAGPAIGGGGGAAAATGGGPTFAAADPTIPLVAPSGGSPQQQRVAAAMAIAYAGAYQQGAAAPTFTPGYGFSTAYAGGGYVGGSQVPGVGAGAGTPPPGPPTPQPGGGGGLGVGVAGTAVARGFMAGLPFGPTLLQLATGPVGMAAVAGYMAGSYMLNAWDVSVQRGAAIQAGQLITPEMRERWDMQRNIGWVPLVGPRVMQVQGARLGFEQKLHSLDERTRAIGGGTGLEPFLYETQRRAHWTGAVLERTVPVLGAEERIELASRAIEMMPELALPGRQKALASDIDRLYRRYQYGAKDVAAGLESLFSRPEFDLLRIENAKALLAGGTDTPVGRRMAERMTTAALLSGDVSAAAMAAQGRNAGLSTDEMRLGREQYSRGAYGRTYAEWAGFHESIAAGLEAFGATGTQVAGELRRGQDSAAQAARRMIERARRAEEIYAQNPTPENWAALARLKGEAARVAAQYPRLGREAMQTELAYNLGILGSQAQLAELEGRSPAEFLRGQATEYGNLLANPEAMLGQGVRLSPREQLEYRLRQRGAQFGAVGAEQRYGGTIALAGQRMGEARIGGMLAGGELWSPEMQTAFGDIARYTQERIAVIDRAIQQYAALGAQAAVIEPLRAERAELGAALRGVQARAFQVAYQTMQVPITAAEQIGGIGAGRAMALGQAPGTLAAPFALQTRAAGAQVALAQQKLADAIRMNRPTDILQAQVELEQAQTQQAVLPFQQIEQRYGQAMRVPGAYGAGLTTAAGITGLARGTAAATPETLAAIGMLQQQMGLAGGRLQETMATPGAGPALVAEAWQGYQQARGALAQGWMGATAYQPSPGLEERFEQARFGQQVLQSTMTARGSVRAMARERMGAAEEMLAELNQQRRATLSQVPAELRPAMELQFNRQARALQMERVSAQQELEQGWLERVVSASWNMPENANLVLNEFNYAGAVMRGGVKARHLGSTSADLDYYREQAMGYMTYGGAGRFGTPRSFLENAMSGVTDTGSSEYSLGLPLSMSGLAALPNPQAPPGMGGGPATLPPIRIEVVVIDPSGTILGSAQQEVSLDNGMGISLRINPFPNTGLGQSK